MKYRILWLALAVSTTAWLAGSNTSLPVQAGEKGKAFFNGKDLEGFEGRLEYWSVKDGAVVGSAPEGLKFNTFLCTKEKYGDFQLQFQVKLTKGANSGVQIRSKLDDRDKFAVTGPQCDMGQQYWGCLYGENFGGMMKEADPKIVSKVLKEDDFNDYYIRAVGKRIIIKLNGETTVDGEFEKAPDTGIIAFQIHSGGPMEVIFKNIKFTPIVKE